MVFQNTGKLANDQAYKDGEDAVDRRLEQALVNDEIDAKLGYDRYKDPKERLGWLVNLHTADYQDDEKRIVSAVDFYFIEEDGGRFKVTLPYRPYFYAECKSHSEKEVQVYLMKKFAGKIAEVEIIQKEALDLHNHLIGLKRSYLKLSFLTTELLTKVKRDVQTAVRKNQEAAKKVDVITEAVGSATAGKRQITDLLENIIDIREYDVPYHCRVSIDLSINVGKWYAVRGKGPSSNRPTIEARPDMLERPDAIVLAYDIETTKLPLKFPDSATDQIMMISYMIDAQGYLITNREIVSADIEDFEYTPKPEYEGPFTVFNEPDEVSLIRRFLDHILEVKPHIISTFNGDFFDWPFVDTRAAIHGIDLYQEIGFQKDTASDQYKSRPIAHLDCYKWVKRDSYLPVGSQNLKAVARNKLRYDPVELDPEEMCPMASEQPQVLATYSVSDSVATYYLYMKYVDPFIFALCTIIPLEPDEVLRKGSGTLCEALLMVQAYHANIIYPNKHDQVYNKLSDDGHVLDSETYVGGHVEAIESGVFRSDIPMNFRIDKAGVQQLLDSAERTLKFVIETEEKIPLDQVTNFDEILADIKAKLVDLRDNPIREERPMIYHLDVGAMYPNIILTNRLQPPAIVDEATCAACDFNKPKNRCQRKMPWMWRGELMSANRAEFGRIQHQLEGETFPPSPMFPHGNPRAFYQLTKEERGAAEKKRLNDYCRKAYKKAHYTRLEKRTSTICQRENSFYVDTVRAFRDRRYEFKGLTKVWNKKLAEAKSSGDAADIKKASNMAILYDSLQLAHKCILNSFYGYVMRKGARWYSMEMAGIVCNTGADIIKRAREITEAIGRPLELDTDGIWAALPSSFPEVYTIKSTHPKKSSVSISYPGAVLNVMVKDNFTNDQYNDLVDPSNHRYSIHAENSIFFEVDGPYLSMILPASKEEGKKLKKRYAVFNPDGSLAELKGFEIKRRGELQLIKHFQSSVFDAFLKGETLAEAYASAANVANFWIDVLYSRAANMPDSELFDLISENRSMSRKLEDYGTQKSTSISTARRLAEFLGDQMVKDAGLSCRFIISKKPEGAPVTERAIPLAIFQSELTLKKHYLRKWLKSPGLQNFDIRNILDWDYYLERLGGTVQKIITIPAALQGIQNPVPRIAHPDWLHKIMLDRSDVYKQRKLTDMFSGARVRNPLDDMPDSANEQDEDAENRDPSETPDLEDLGGAQKRKPGASVTRKRPREPAVDMLLPWKEQLGPMPDQAEEFREWVKYQKRKWTIQMEQRKQLRKRRRLEGEEAGTAAISRPRIAGNLSSYISQTSHSMLNSVWQVVEFHPSTRRRGQYKAFVLIGNNLHTVTINLPRLFYVNFRTIHEEQTGCRKVNRILPRNHPVYHLYENTIPEEHYVKHASQISAELCNPDIVGIYETETPAEFRLMTQIGCLCTVSQKHKKLHGIRETETFDFRNLEFRAQSQHPYLEDGSLQYIYIYHNASAGKEMFGVFIPHLKTAQLFILDSTRVNNLPNLPTLCQKAMDSSEVEPEFRPPVDVEFQANIETTVKNVNKAVNKMLSRYKEEKRGPTALLVQSSILDLEGWHSRIEVTDDFPVITLRKSLTETYNVLNWQRVAAETTLMYYARAFYELMILLEQCRYYHMPIGNAPPDPELYACDLFFARHLTRDNHVLWSSARDRPDLGGQAIEDRRLESLDDEDHICINSPGFYLSTCVELSVQYIVVNAIIQGHLLLNADGSSDFKNTSHQTLGEMVGSKGQSTHVLNDETAIGPTAFRAVKTMLNSWFAEVLSNSNQLASDLIENFHRWLTDPSALLYDPALRKHIHSITKKVFAQLISELRRLGAVVIYADMRRVVINTKKSGLDEAVGYVSYILDSITRNQYFRCTSFKFIQAWDCLLWMDRTNHSGIRGELTPSQAAALGDSLFWFDSDMVDKFTQLETEVSEEPTDISALKRRLQSLWNINHYLTSTPLQKSFYSVISSYIMSVYGHLLEAEGMSSQAGETPVRKLNSQATQALQSSSISSLVAEFSLDMISQEVAPQLYSMVTNAPRTRREPAPLLPGSHRNLDNPALEAANFICHVLSLDASITEKMEDLKLDLLRLLHVGQFSSKAEFVNPSTSYILPEVLCSECNLASDVDLCREFRLDTSVRPPKVLRGWTCHTCGAEYSTRAIEARLDRNLQTLVRSHTLQDVSCIKCGLVMMRNMSSFCECSGRYKNTVHSETLRKTLHVFDSLSRCFDLKGLQQSVGLIVKLNPAILKPAKDVF